MEYSEEFKNSVVSRILSKEISVAAATTQYKISKTTLYNWKAEALNGTISASQSKESMPTMSQPEKLRLPKGVEYLEAHEAVVLMKHLDEAAFGALCRTKGYLPDEVKKWDAWFIKHPMAVNAEELHAARKDLQKAHGQAKESNSQISELKRTVAKQEKALSTAAVQLLLSKKAAAIFGEGGS